MILFQDYIARFGHGSAKLAKQAQSKEKVLAKMVASGLTEKVVTDKVSAKNLDVFDGRYIAYCSYIAYCPSPCMYVVLS